MAIALNRMPQAINPRSTQLTKWHERNGYYDEAEQATSTTYRWAEALLRRTTTIDSFSTLANDGNYDKSVCECTKSDEYPNASSSDTAAICADGPNLQCESIIGSHAGKSKHKKCNSTDPHQVDDNSDWEPLGYPYKPFYGVYHQSAMNYTAVSTHQCSTDTLQCLHTNALRIMLQCLPPKRTTPRC